MKHAGLSRKVASVNCLLAKICFNDLWVILNLGGGAFGKATGVFTGGIDTGIFAGSLILGYIGDWFGLNILFICAGLGMASAFILFPFRKARHT